jgi:hypothetical protein
LASPQFCWRGTKAIKEHWRIVMKFWSIISWRKKLNYRHKGKRLNAVAWTEVPTMSMDIGKVQVLEYSLLSKWYTCCQSRFITYRYA